MSNFAQPLLCVDVGNSRIKFGVFVHEDLKSNKGMLPRYLQTAVTTFDEAIPWEQIRGWLSESEYCAPASVIAGTNPDGVAHLLSTWPQGDWKPPVVVNDVSALPLEIRVESPQRVGIDRLLNAVAANVIRPAQQPAIIIDAGTATTVDFVAPDGDFLGGAILPGLQLSARSLHEYTALLPLISVEELYLGPPSPLGRSTDAAIRSGVFWGQLGAIKELVTQMTIHNTKPLDELGIVKALGPTDGSLQQNQTPFLVLTGGGGKCILPYLPESRWEPHLALQGLAVITDKGLPATSDL